MRTAASMDRSVHPVESSLLREQTSGLSSETDTVRGMPSTLAWSVHPDSVVGRMGAQRSARGRWGEACSLSARLLTERTASPRG
jgi:hypothetical protein